jgi:hypothetical protein
VTEENYQISREFEVLTAVDLKSGKQSFHSGFLLGLIFDPEEGGEMFLRNVG